MECTDNRVTQYRRLKSTLYVEHAADTSISQTHEHNNEEKGKRPNYFIVVSQTNAGRRLTTIFRCVCAPDLLFFVVPIRTTACMYVRITILQLVCSRAAHSHTHNTSVMRARREIMRARHRDTPKLFPLICIYISLCCSFDPH